MDVLEPDEKPQRVKSEKVDRPKSSRYRRFFRITMFMILIVNRIVRFVEMVIERFEE